MRGILVILITLFAFSEGYAACGTPTVSGTTILTGTSAILDWTAVSGATSYNVRYRVVGSGTAGWVNDQAVGSPPVTSDTITALLSGTDYEWEVQTVCAGSGGGTSSFTSATGFTTPSIIVVGGDKAACAGADVTFISQMNTLPSNVNPFNCTYQWQSSSTGNNPWTNIVGGTNFYLTLSNVSTSDTKYYRVGTSGCGTGNRPAELLSAPIHFVVANQPAFTATVSDQVLCGLGSSVTLNNPVVGGAGNCTETWQKYNTSSGVWEDKGTGSSFLLATNTYPAGGLFRSVEVCDGEGCQSATSNEIQVTVGANPSLDITASHPDSLCLGSVVSLTGSLTGGGGSCSTLKWVYSIDTSGALTFGATGNDLTFIPSSSGNYKATLSITSCSGNGCSTPASVSKEIYVYDQPLAAISPRDPVVCANEANTFTATTTAHEAPGCVRQWYVRQDSSSYTLTPLNVGNSTSCTFQFTGNYIVKMVETCTETNCQGAEDSVRVTVTSSASVASTTINEDGNNYVIPVARTTSYICKNPGSFNLTANINGSNGSCYVYWYSPEIRNNFYWTVYGFSYPYVFSNTLDKLDIPAISSGASGTVIPLTMYYNCGSICSNITFLDTLIVKDPATISLSSNPGDGINICAGSTNITTTATVSGGTNNCHIHWYTGYDINNLVEDTAHRDAGSVTNSAPTIGTFYVQAVYTCSDLLGNCNRQVATQVFFVYSPLVVTITNTTREVCQGYSQTYQATGADPILCPNGRQWKVIDSSSHSILTTVTSTSLTYQLNTAGTYYVVAKDSCPFSGACNTGTDTAVIHVYGQPSVSVDGPDRTFCKGSNILLTEHHSGGVTIPTIQWQLFRDTAWINGTTSSGTAGSQFSYFNIDKTTSFRSIMLSNGPACNPDTATTVVVTVIPQPNIILDTAGLPKHVCTNFTETVNLLPDSGIQANPTEYIINWYKSNNGGAYIQDAAQHSRTYTDVVSPSTVDYVATMQAIATDSGCITTHSDTARVIVDNSAALSTPVTNYDTICIGGAATLSVSQLSGVPCALIWLAYDTLTNSWPPVGLSGTSVAVTPITNRLYRALDTCHIYGCSVDTSLQVQVNVVPQPTIQILTNVNSNICSDTGVHITLNTINIGGSELSYQWQTSPTGLPLSWTDIVGETLDSITVSPTATTFYKINKISSVVGCAPLVTDSIKISVYPQPHIDSIILPPSLCTNDPNNKVIALHSGGVPDSTYFIWIKTINGIRDTVLPVQGNDTIPGFRSNDTIVYKAIMVSAAPGCNADTTRPTVTTISKYTPDISDAFSLDTLASIRKIKCYLQDGGKLVFYNTIFTTGRVSQYSIDGGIDFQSDETFDHLAFDTSRYYLVIKDTTSGCKSDLLLEKITYQDSSLMNVNLDIISYPFCDSNKIGRLSVTATGGIPPYTYQWRTAGQIFNTVQVADTIAPGNYLVAVTDAAGCVKSDSTILAFIPGLKIVMDTLTYLPCTGANNASLNPIVTGGTVGYHYTWFPSDNNHRHNTRLDSLPAGTYQALVVDTNGCSTSATAQILEADSFKIALLLDDSTKCGKDNSGGNIQVLNNNAHLHLTNDVFQYRLFNSGGTQVYLQSDTGTVSARFDSLQIGQNYTYLVIDSTNTCRTTGSFFFNPRVGQPLTPTFTVIPDNQSDPRGTGSIKVDISGSSLQGFNIKWSTGEVGQLKIRNLSFGTYTVTISTDFGQCVGVDTILVPLFIGIDNVADGGNFMLPNRPNPFTESTVITYQLADKLPVTIAVFDALGRQVAILTDEVKEPGTYSLDFNSGTLPNGIYYCSFRAGKNTMMNKMIILR